MTVVLDTCVPVVCWTREPQRLSRKGADALDRLGGPARGLVSSASIWEIALKNRAGRLELGMTPAEYLARILRLPLDIVPVDAALWIESGELEWEHRDPVDRLVVAMSRRHGVDLVTSDHAIRRWHPHVRW